MFFSLAKLFCLFLTQDIIRCERPGLVRNIDIKIEQNGLNLRVEFKALDQIFLLDLMKTDDGLGRPREDNTEDGIFANDHTSLLLKYKEESFSLEGIVEDDFIIRPSDDNLSHIITEIKDENLASDYEVPESALASSLPTLKLKPTRERRSVPSTVRPEILVVVDQSLYQQLGSDTTTTNNYVRNFWNAVNLRFRLMSNPRVELNIAGIIIAKSSAQTPFLRDSKVSGDRFEARKALDLMGKHFYKSDPLLPVYDIVVTMTNLDMCRYKGGARGSCNKNTVGYAYVGGACVVNKALRKINSVALVEDSGGYSGVIVAAHEVAHLLGAVHDGDGPATGVGGPGARQCDWGEGYIMSDARRSVRGLSWSDCTQAQLSHFLQSSTAQCLTNPPHNTKPGLSLLADHRPSLDEQCRRDQGSRACFHDSRVCTQLFCHVPATGGCVAYRPALEGSDCGQGKVCTNGVCQEKKEAGYVRVLQKQHNNIKRISETSGGNNIKRISETSGGNNIKRISETNGGNKIKTISSNCHDKKKINVRGVRSCHDLLQSFSYAYCGNKYIESICCASHALFCS